MINQEQARESDVVRAGYHEKIGLLQRVKSAFQNKDVWETLQLSFFAGLSMGASNIHNFFATIMIGHTGEKSTEQISAMGLALIVLLLFTSPMNAFGSAAQSLISQLWGKGERQKALISFKSAMITSFIVSGVLSVIVFVLGKEVIKLTAPSEEVVKYGSEFLAIRVIGLPATAVTFVMRGFFDGIGAPREHLKFNLSSTIFCIIFSYFLIFGVFFPRMELNGFAVASSLSSFFALFHGIMLIREDIKKHFPFEVIKSYEYRKNIVDFAKTNLNISLPASGAQFIAAFSFLLFMWFSGKSGVEHQAVTFILVNILGVILLPIMAIGVSLAGVIGRQIGKNQIEKAKKTFYDTIVVFGIFSFAISLLFILSPKLVIDIFSNDDEVVKIGSRTLFAFSPALFFLVISMLIINTLIGLGDTKFVVLVETVLQILVFLPSLVVVGLILKAGSTALWTVIAIYFTILFVILILRLRSGKWIKIHI